jgi:hypothetical protein
MAPRKESFKDTRVGTWYDYGHVNPQARYERTSATGEELIYSRGNYGWQEAGSKEFRNLGGEFYTRKYNLFRPTVRLSQEIHGAYSAYQYTYYAGSVCGDWQNYSYPLADFSSKGWGPIAYQRMKPTKPVFSGLNSIYELKDVPGMLLQRFIGLGLKGIGSYYLALKFGWEPLLKDLIKLYTVQQDVEKKLQWLLRHNGKPVRTRVMLSDTQSSPTVTSGTLSGVAPGLPDAFYIASRNWEKTFQTKETFWASATWKFFLPENVGGVNWQPAIKRGLLGLSPNPAVIYKAIPWSWLIDWFFNVGNVIDNLNSGVADKLACENFFVMRRVEESTLIKGTTTFLGVNGAAIPVITESTLTRTHKMRFRGDAFGFGTNPATLNSGQLAILGALGASRL